MPILGKYINEKCRKLVNDFIDLSSDKSDTIDANRIEEKISSKSSRKDK